MAEDERRTTTVGLIKTQGGRLVELEPIIELVKCDRSSGRRRRQAVSFDQGPAETWLIQSPAVALGELPTDEATYEAGIAHFTRDIEPCLQLLGVIAPPYA